MAGLSPERGGSASQQVASADQHPGPAFSGNPHPGGCLEGAWPQGKGPQEGSGPGPVWEAMAGMPDCPPSSTVYGVELFLKVAGLGPVEYLSSGWNL